MRVEDGSSSLLGNRHLWSLLPRGRLTASGPKCRSKPCLMIRSRHHLNCTSSRCQSTQLAEDTTVHLYNRYIRREPDSTAVRRPTFHHTLGNPTARRRYRGRALFSFTFCPAQGDPDGRPNIQCSADHRSSVGGIPGFAMVSLFAQLPGR